MLQTIAACSKAKWEIPGAQRETNFPNNLVRYMIPSSKSRGQMCSFGSGFVFSSYSTKGRLPICPGRIEEPSGKRPCKYEDEWSYLAICMMGLQRPYGNRKCWQMMEDWTPVFPPSLSPEYKVIWMLVSALGSQVGIGSDSKVKKYKVNRKMHLLSCASAFSEGSSFSMASPMLSPPLSIGFRSSALVFGTFTHRTETFYKFSALAPKWCWRRHCVDQSSGCQSNGL